MASPAAGDPGAPSRPGDPIAIVTDVPVLGMTCRSCEVRIERHVGRIPGVQRVRASASRASVRIEASRRLSPSALAKAIDAAGYEIGRTPWVSRDRVAWAVDLLGR